MSLSSPVKSAAVTVLAVGGCGGRECCHSDRPKTLYFPNSISTHSIHNYRESSTNHINFD